MAAGTRQRRTTLVGANVVRIIIAKAAHPGVRDARELFAMIVQQSVRRAMSTCVKAA